MTGRAEFRVYRKLNFPLNRIGKYPPVLKTLPLRLRCTSFGSWSGAKAGTLVKIIVRVSSKDNLISTWKEQVGQRLWQSFFDFLSDALVVTLNVVDYVWRLSLPWNRPGLSRSESHRSYRMVANSNETTASGKPTPSWSSSRLRREPSRVIV